MRCERAFTPQTKLGIVHGSRLRAKRRAAVWAECDLVFCCSLCRARLFALLLQVKTSKMLWCFTTHLFRFPVQCFECKSMCEFFGGLVFQRHGVVLNGGGDGNSHLSLSLLRTRTHPTKNNGDKEERRSHFFFRRPTPRVLLRRAGPGWECSHILPGQLIQRYTYRAWIRLFSDADKKGRRRHSGFLAQLSG